MPVSRAENAAATPQPPVGPFLWSTARLMPAPRRARLSALARHLRPRCSCEAELAARASGARVGAIAGGAVQAEEEPMVEMSERDKFMLDLNGFLVVEVSALRQPIVSPH